METITAKYETLSNALVRFGAAVNYLAAAREKHDKLNRSDDEDIDYTLFRDATIQRFEFSVELFWKYVLLYLVSNNIEVKIHSPNFVIRAAGLARLISEEQAADFMSMIKSRNLTSHIYKEEIAEQLAREIPQYYELMKQLAVILKP